MHAQKRYIWLTAVIALVTVVAAVGSGIWWSVAHAPKPQFITLQNGLQFRFAGVTYGTNNVPPSLLAKMAHWLPKPLADRVRQYAGNRLSQWNEGSSPEPRLQVWFERVGTNSPAGLMTNFNAVLADEAGVEAGALDYGAFAGSVAWSYDSFTVVPRRSRVIECILYPNGIQYNPGAAPLGRIRFSNPLYGGGPAWQPEPIPAVKRAGDLEVRLEKFGTGMRLSGRPPVLANGKQGTDYRPLTGTPGADTFFDVTLKSTAGTNEQWVTQAAQLSDATGNVLASSAQVSSSGNVSSPMTFSGEYRLSIPGTLWTNEAAWKLKLWLKRKLPLGSNEYVTFHNVPTTGVTTTNWTPLTNISGDVQIVLTKFSMLPLRFSRSGPPTTIRVDWPERAEDVAVDFVDMTAQNGQQFTLDKGSSGWGPFYREANVYEPLTNLPPVDVTWAVQKMRTVEFMVKPGGE